MASVRPHGQNDGAGGVDETRRSLWSPVGTLITPINFSVFAVEGGPSLKRGAVPKYLATGPCVKRPGAIGLIETGPGPSGAPRAGSGRMLNANLPAGGGQINRGQVS